ncbi:quinone oxidoreductase-like protein 2 isoform X3 [Dromaius novaehollandiae]|uniref:quinone oxidoreductase-like protein 2 isoform X3 n=1 Tax=Dromaius novaehollandiae TaxID=8790 RepID=UPI00311DC31E
MTHGRDCARQFIAAGDCRVLLQHDRLWGGKTPSASPPTGARPGAASRSSSSAQPVRVGVHYCGLNFADILACQGLYQEKHTLPFTPGMEFSGTVMETGGNVSAVKEGCRVVGVTGTTAMAEECVVDQKMLWRIPEGVSYEDAAVLPVTYGTATLVLDRRARLQPGETVLVTAGAGATGLAVIDLAVNIFKAKVIAAAGSDAKCELALKSGASHSVNYSWSNLRDEVKRLTDGRGADVAVEAVGGDIFKAALQRCAEFGLGGQDCGDRFCWRKNPLDSCQLAASEERVCHGNVLESVPEREFPCFLLCDLFCSPVLPGGKDPS